MPSMLKLGLIIWHLLTIA